MSECGEDNLINELKSLDITKDIAEPVKFDINNSEANEVNSSSDLFGVIIYDDDDDDDDDENSINLIPRGPTKQSNKQRTMPYDVTKKGSYYSDLQNLKLKSQQHIDSLSPSQSVHFSPSKQIENCNDLAYILTPESVFNNSPESINWSDETQFEDLYSIIKDDDSGTFSISKQSSENDLFDDLETPAGIEYPEVVKYLIDKVENVPMEKICKIEDMEKSNQNLPTKNNYGQIDAYIAVAKMELEHIMKIDSDGDSCLIVAAAKDKTFLVKALAERLEREGCLSNAINHVNVNGITALYCAVMNNNPALVSYLASKNANVNLSYFTKPKDRNNSLIFRLIHCVSERGHEYVTTLKQLLTVTNLEIDCYNSKGCTPLLCAIEKHNLNVVDSRLTISLLVQHGASLLKENNQSYKPPLQIAIEKKSPELVKLLLSLAIELDLYNASTVLQPSSNFPFKQEPTANKAKCVKEEYLEFEFLESFQNFDQHIMPLDGSMYRAGKNGYNDPRVYLEENGCSYFAGQRMPNQIYTQCGMHNGGSVSDFQIYADATTQNGIVQQRMNPPYRNEALFLPGVNARLVEQRSSIATSHPQFSCNQPATTTLPPPPFNRQVNDQADQVRFLPTQIQQYNCMSSDCGKPVAFNGQAKREESLIERMLNFRNKGQSDFSMLGCAYDVCAVCGADEKSKEVVKILLSYGATVVPKSRVNPISNLPEFAIYQKKKKCL